MESSDNINNDCPSDQNVVERRSRKIKNLEKEVEMILFQEESRDHEEAVLEPSSPSTSKDIDLRIRCKDVATPTASHNKVLSDLMQTPRRSCRKSIKPAQDYDDIIVKRSLRSAGKTSKSLLMILDEPENILKEQTEDLSQPKWSSAVVGKSSSKRGRKSKKSTTAKKHKKDNVIQAGEPVDVKTKLELDCTDDKEMNNKENATKHVFTTLLTDETVPQINSSMCEKNDYANDQNEKLPANEHDGMFNNETLQVHGLPDIMPESVILSPEEQGKIEIEVALNVNTVEDTTKMISEVDNDVNSGKEENADDKIKIVAPKSLDCTLIWQEEDSKDQNEHSGVVIKEEECLSSANLNPTNQNFSTVCVKDDKDKESSNVSFGSYLKSNQINVSDLGLIPIKDEDDVEQTINNIIQTEDDKYNIADEMPPLIVLDDEEDEDGICKVSELNIKESENKPNLNETFEAVEEDKQENCPTKEFSFQCYDSVDNSLKMFLQNEAAAILASPTTVTISNPSTPKQKAKPFRFPTPHAKKVLSEKTSSAKKLPLHNTNMSLALTTMGPKEFVLRGIRKRSKSVCLIGSGENYAINGSATKQQKPLRGPLPNIGQQKSVNFHSPANQTTIIDDIDRIIEDSVKKSNINKAVHQRSNVTTRRKRSLSLDESMMNKTKLTKIPRLGEVSSSSSSFIPSRTKLPNFAAIHQKHFQKMESVVDHVARKQERSKVLINSASKIKLASAQKTLPFKKNLKPSCIEPPKASKKLNMEGSFLMKSKPVLNMMLTTKLENSASKRNFKENHSMITTSKLPHPRDLPDPSALRVINRHQQHLLSKKHLKPTQTTNVLAKTKSSATTPLKAQKQKPFNLSTHLPIRTQPVKPSTSAVATSSVASSSNVSSIHMQDKTSSRLQRHMEMFKGRAATAPSGMATRKIEASIRGVRSNRRFELQMQHRKNLEK